LLALGNVVSLRKGRKKFREKLNFNTLNLKTTKNRVLIPNQSNVAIVRSSETTSFATEQKIDNPNPFFPFTRKEGENANVPLVDKNWIFPFPSFGKAKKSWKAKPSLARDGQGVSHVSVSK